VRELEARIKELGKSAEMHIYADADHAFFNDDRPEVYNRKAATDAWQRTIAFFREHLKEKS
jgi:carboxymethylenebutenolidase